MKRVKMGFTLIELAVVIAIIGILAAVAIPRFQDASAAAEKALILDLVSQLYSARNAYIASHPTVPASDVHFSSFVTTGPATGDYTLSLQNWGTNHNASSACSINSDFISCSMAASVPLFKNYGKVFYKNVDGIISVNGTPSKDGVPMINQ